MTSRNRMRAVLPLLCLALAVAAGCTAKSRNGPFDVPAAAPSVPQKSAPASGLKAAADEIESLAIHFAFDRADLTPEARRTLDRAGELLRRAPSIRIGIRGHCDVRGPRHYNFDLGDRRARAAYGYLTKAGVDPAQMAMVTFGKGTPASSGKSEPAHAENRRCEFIVLTTSR